MTSRTFLAALLVLTACGTPDPATVQVARAAEHELTVEEGARLLAAGDSVPDVREVALGLATLWVDYVLLGTALAEDSTLSQLEVEPIVEQRAERAALAALRDSVVRADASIGDSELRARYGREGEGSEVRARQILIRVATDAPQSVRDSAREAIAALRRRIVEGGESFEEAVYALEPGEVSEPIETRYGYHLVRLEERRTPTLEQFGQRIRRQRAQAASTEYLTRLQEAAEPEIAPDAPRVVRRLIGAGAPADTAAIPVDTLVRYHGGEITSREVVRYWGQLPLDARDRIVDAGAEQIRDGVLLPLVRQELVESEAARQGLLVSAAEKEAAAESFRQQLREAGRSLGLWPLTADTADAPGDLEAAVERVLTEIVRNERQVLSLGPAALALRAAYPFEIREDRMADVERRLEELRAPGAGEDPAGGTEGG